MENIRKKGSFFCLPRVEKFCFLIKNLKVASAIIAVLSVLISYHEIQIVLRPGCENLYMESDLTKWLKIVGYILHIVNILMITSAVIFLFSLFWKWNAAGYFFLLFSAVSGLISAVFMVLYVMRIFKVACYDSSGASDIITLFVYCILWTYFFIVVISYKHQSRSAEENPET